jgi:Uma2 family endonuclease
MPLATNDKPTRHPPCLILEILSPVAGLRNEGRAKRYGTLVPDVPGVPDPYIKKKKLYQNNAFVFIVFFASVTGFTRPKKTS